MTFRSHVQRIHYHVLGIKIIRVLVLTVILFFLFMAFSGRAEPFNDHSGQQLFSSSQTDSRIGTAGHFVDLAVTGGAVIKYGSVVEANPLGLPVVIAGKVIAEPLARQWPEHCFDLLAGSRSVGFGGAIGSLVSLAGAPPVGAVIATVLGSYAAHELMVKQEAIDDCFVRDTIIVDADRITEQTEGLMDIVKLGSYGPPGRPEKVVVTGWRYRYD